MRRKQKDGYLRSAEGKGRIIHGRERPARMRTTLVAYLIAREKVGGGDPAPVGGACAVMR